MKTIDRQWLDFHKKYISGKMMTRTYVLSRTRHMLNSYPANQTSNKILLFALYVAPFFPSI
jgi:hypothetical protein